MKNTLMLTALAAPLLVVSVATAQNYALTEAQIQSFDDATSGFHSSSTQYSTINSITNIPGGIEVDVSFAYGQNASTFDPFFGANFARVTLRGFSGGYDLTSFDGFEYNISVDQASVTAQVFTQTAPSWSYFEQNSSLVGDASDEVVSLNLAGVGIVPDVNNEILANSWGVQLAMFSLDDDMIVGLGEPYDVTFQITTTIPEPTSALLAAFAGLGVVASRRRR